MGQGKMDHVMREEMEEGVGKKVRMWLKLLEEARESGGMS